MRLSRLGTSLHRSMFTRVTDIADFAIKVEGTKEHFQIGSSERGRSFSGLTLTYCVSVTISGDTFNASESSPLPACSSLLA